MDCKFRFSAVKISPSSRTQVEESQQYEIASERIIEIDILREMGKGQTWTEFKIIAKALNDEEEIELPGFCILCKKVIYKGSKFFRYKKCNHLLHKECDRDLDTHDRKHCIGCDEEKGFASIVHSRKNSIDTPSSQSNRRGNGRNNRKNMRRGTRNQRNRNR